MNRLGKGLGALIPEGPESTDKTTGITTVEIDCIHSNYYQPRKVFDQKSLEDLAVSIRENGIIQPIIVTKQDNSSYELIAGERRLKAAKLAGIKKIPVIIRSVSKQEQLQYAIIENIQRKNLNCIEEGLAYKRLIDEFEMTHSQVSEIMGKERTTITNMIRLLKLPEEVKTLLLEEKIYAGHARAVLKILPQFQSDFAKLIIKNNWSVRQTEKEVDNFIVKEKTKIKKKNKNSFKEIEKELNNKFNLKIKILDENNKGKITVFYKNESERLKFIEFLKK